MITAVFEEEDQQTATTEPIYQYNHGEVLRVTGLDFPATARVDFSYDRRGCPATPKVGIKVAGGLEAPVPEEMMVHGDSKENYRIYAFIFITNGDNGQTVRRVKIPVRARPKIYEYQPPEGEPDFLEKVLEAINASVDLIELSEDMAEAWAHGHPLFPELAKDNAKYYADLARESQKATEDVRAEIDGKVRESKKEIDDYVREKEENLRGETGDVHFATFEIIDGVLTMFSDPGLEGIEFNLTPDGILTFMLT